MSDSNASLARAPERRALLTATTDRHTPARDGVGREPGLAQPLASPAPTAARTKAARTLTTVALPTVRVTGPTLVGLGLLFWSGRAFSLLPIHMAIGLVFVLAVLALAGAARTVGLRWALVLPSVALALIIPPFGIVQGRLLPGPAHWVVRVTHLLLGMAAMVAAARLARFTRAAAAVPLSASDPEPRPVRSSDARDRTAATAAADR